MTLKRTQAIAFIALLLDDDSEQENVPSRKKRLIWVKPWLRKRVEQGTFNNLFQELLVGDSTSFRDYIRMDRLHFYYLVERLYPYLVKEDKVMRESIKPAEQCCIFLRYVASGESYRSLEYQFRVSRRSISRRIPTVAKAIIDELQHQYLKTPNTVDEWLIISEKFYQRWNFPNMIGAVDGKQIVLEHKYIVHIHDTP